MLRNYFKIAFRHFLKNRQFTFLNLIGLSTGLAGALLIYLWVYDELTIDKFHEKGLQLFQVMEQRPHAGGINTTSETSPLLAEALMQTMPEVEYAAASTPPSWFPKMVLSVGDNTVKAAGIFAGKDYFNIFSYPLLQGSSMRVLTDKHAIVISEKLAMKLFHTTENLIGKTIHWQLYDIKKQSVIAGVFKGTPANSSIQFDLAFPFATFKDIVGITGTMNSQNNSGPFYTYLVLKKGTSVAHFNDKLNAFMNSYDKSTDRNLFLKPYGENYLYGNYENGIQSGGRIGYVKLFSLIALFIVIIACINFMNLSTAKASGRMKEIGICKAMGADRKTLILQHMGEALLMAFLSLIIALLLVQLLLPRFNEITGKHLVVRADINLILSFLGITLFTGLIAGSYPALYLSGFNPVAVLKGNVRNSMEELWARKGLVVFQFSLSFIFIAAVLIVYKQITYIQTKNPGYDKDHVIYFESEGNVAASIPAFLSEVKKIPGIVNASAMVGHILGSPGIPVSWKENGREEMIMFRNLHGTYDLIETLGIKMLSGRSFSQNSGTDGSKIIFNEAAIKTMGIKDPVGKVINFAGMRREIAGVVKNFHFESLHESVKPLFIELDHQTQTILVRISPGMERKVIDQLGSFYKSFNPKFSFDYNFLNADFQAQYNAEKQVAELSKYFAGLAVLISCLGLFGLSTFTAERKRKEIGIRKVLGATAKNVMLLLFRDLLLSVLIAMVIAIPLAWWTISSWLQRFAYHIHIGPDVFLIAGGAIIGITLLTISFHTIKATMTNSVNDLRTE
ncbi:FtsX-like permease family protein [Chitinophaga oryziterrae]|uniref:FtsX-like permease family protein n=1 Tax=Chitinophaga oryziterrae TaxID=1031224 RepID=A0A6N8JDV4_9BACT|nr:FtsX-like permease family protein [Chitinophaga oryziterrae]MVT43410.1 FtsX-like permease family protein [Chitinophaga oryziterrae]